MSVTAVAEPSAGTALCEARHVALDFRQPNGRARRVLEDISVTVRPKEVVALLGPSGCGKSTLLRLLAGLLRPTEGAVLHHGAPLVGLNPGAAIVFQSFALYPWMTVGGNVATVLRAAGLGEAQIAERVRDAIRLVGLTEFEAVYPRALSGGMKQRVGIARALAVHPEVLFMDEPFSQVDALTAESMRAEVLDIWASQKHALSSILLVSHDIKEVAFMADRIVVMGADPGQIRTVVANDLPRPRDYRARELLDLVDRLHDVIVGSELPDLPQVPAEAGAPVIEPVPDALPSQIVGLLEYLDARSGRNDVFHIASDTHQEFGRLLAVVKAAEMLDFVDTPKTLVVLEPLGQRFVQADPEGRQAIWREKVLGLQILRELLETLGRAPEHALDRDFVLERIVLRLPQENYERLFHTLMAWGRYAGLLHFDEGADQVVLDDAANPV